LKKYTAPYRIAMPYLFGLLMCFGAASTSAQQLTDCSDIPASDVPTTLDCLDANYAILDKELNQIYKKLMSSLAEDQKKSLRDEQRKWLKKKAACKSKEESPRAFAGQVACEVDETQKRVTYLKNLSK
jgi:uncharacterized protein YecT (DUF1311 family)